MIEVRDCDDYEAAKEFILEYSKIKGAEGCFVSLDKELQISRDFIRMELCCLDMTKKTPLLQLQSRG